MHHAAPYVRIPTSTAMTNFGRLLGSLLFAVLVLFAETTTADFTNSFDGVKAGSTLSLTWDNIPAQYYPLCITAQLIDKGADGRTATAYKANVTSGLNGTSYAWKGLPFPLNHVVGGMYQLEIHPAGGMTGSDTHATLLARSSFFEIQKPSSSDTESAKPPSPTLAGSQGGGTSNVNKPLAIGLGVAIGVPSIVALALVSWCFRRRQRRATLEKRRRTRRDFIIN